MINFQEKFPLPSDEEFQEKLSKELKTSSLSALDKEFEDLTFPALVLPSQAGNDKIISKKAGWIFSHDLRFVKNENFTQAFTDAVNHDLGFIAVNKEQLNYSEDLSKLKGLIISGNPEAGFQTKAKHLTILLANDTQVPGSSGKTDDQNLPNRWIKSEINGSAFRNEGATLTQQYAFCLTKAHESLISLTNQGLSPEEAANQIWFSVAIGPSYLAEIAGLRAFRFLWEEMLEAYGVKNSKTLIHAQTSMRWLSQKDVYTNLLRTTTQAMSAVIGGADILSVSPFDQTIKTYNPFSARLARNIQHILKSESSMGLVSDPAAGSYLLTEMTQRIKEKTWQLFLEIEKAGGFKVQFEKGDIMNEVKRNAREQLDSVTSGERTMIGVNKYKGKEEELVKESGLPQTLSSAIDSAKL